MLQLVISTIVTVLGAAWYLSGRLTKMETKLDALVSDISPRMKRLEDRDTSHGEHIATLEAKVNQ